MSMIDLIESLGQAVSTGSTSREQAIIDLMVYSDGGLTRIAAADLVDHWDTARTRYEDATA